MGRYYRKPVSAERQRKSALIKAAVEARGLRAETNWRDNTYLHVGGGNWEVCLRYPRTVDVDGNPVDDPYDPPIYGNVVAESFDGLLALFTDDERYADYVYTNCRQYKRLGEECRIANTAYNCALREYGVAHVRALRDDLEGLTGGLSGSIALAATAERKVAEQAYGAYRRAKAAFDDYMAARPTTPEAARAYLTTLGVGKGG